MKNLIFALVLVTSLKNGVAAPVDSLREFILDFRDRMPCGFPEYNLPALAPLLLDTFKIDSEGLFLQVDDLRLSGLHSFDIYDLYLSILIFRMRFEITFDEINLKTKYETDIELGGIDIEGIGGFPKIFGKGDINFTLRNLTLSGNLALKFDPDEGFASLKDIALGLDLDEVHSKITGLLDNEIVNDFINDVLVNAIMTFAKEMRQFVSETLESLITPLADSLLVNLTVQDLLDWINGGGTPGPTNPPCTVKPNISFLFSPR